MRERERERFKNLKWWGEYNQKLWRRGFLFSPYKWIKVQHMDQPDLTQYFSGLGLIWPIFVWEKREREREREFN